MTLYEKLVPGQKWYGIDRFVIGLLRFLMTIEVDGHEYNIALLQWYDIGSKDTETGMTIAKRSARFNFNTIDKIFSPIHLIPFFETPESARVTLENKLQEYDFDKYLINHYIDQFSFQNFYN